LFISNCFLPAHHLEQELHALRVPAVASERDGHGPVVPHHVEPGAGGDQALRDGQVAARGGEVEGGAAAVGKLC